VAKVETENGIFLILLNKARTYGWPGKFGPFDGLPKINMKIS